MIQVRAPEPPWCPMAGLRSRHETDRNEKAALSRCDSGSPAHRKEEEDPGLPVHR
jgi:hypothetical protein